MNQERLRYRSLATKLLEWYLYSSLHIALCAASLTIFGFILSGEAIQNEYVIFVGASTITLYNLHRLIGISKMGAFNHEGRFAIIKLYRHHILIYLIVAALISGWFLLKLPYRLMPWVCGVSILSISYTIPIFKGLRLRDFNYIKIITIAISWSMLCVTIPALFEWDGKLFAIVGESLAMCLFFLGITIPFDIRDAHIDASMNVKTIVTLLGKSKAIGVAKVSIICSTGIILCLSYIVGPSAAYLSWIVVNAITILLLSMPLRNEDWWYTLVYDGLIGMFLLIYLVFNRLL